MALMVIKESIVVVRPDPLREGKNKRVTPEIGKSFDLTDAEIKELRGSRPESFRRPVNETEAANVSEATDFDIDMGGLDGDDNLGGAEAGDEPSAEGAKAGGKGKQAGGKGGKTVVPPAEDDL